MVAIVLWRRADLHDTAWPMAHGFAHGYYRCRTSPMSLLTTTRPADLLPHTTSDCR